MRNKGTTGGEDRCLLFFIKYPEKGKVKTRLAKSIGEEMAARISRDVILAMLSTLNQGRYPLIVCFYPKTSLGNFRSWLGDQQAYLPQRGEDLGERMKSGFLDVFGRGFKRVVLIGGDIPGLSLELIDEAFDALRKKKVAIGPACDGGYYLIGFTPETFSPAVFEGIPWSTERVFEETINLLKRDRRSIHTLPPLRDVDTVEDLDAYFPVPERKKDLP